MHRRGDDQYEGGDQEDGEIRVMDEQDYILSDSYFKFRFDREEPMNWRSIGSLHFDESTGILDNSMEPAGEILMNID